MGIIVVEQENPDNAEGQEAGAAAASTSELVQEGSDDRRASTAGHDADTEDSKSEERRGSKSDHGGNGSDNEDDEHRRRREEKEAIQTLDNVLGRDGTSEASDSITGSLAGGPSTSDGDKEGDGKTGDKQGDGGLLAQIDEKPEALGQSEVVEGEKDKERKLPKIPESTHPPKDNETTEPPHLRPDKLPIAEEERSKSRLDHGHGDDNSSLGDIKIDPHHDTDSGLDRIVPDSPVGINAIEDDGSDSDHTEARLMPGVGHGVGYRKSSNALTGKTHHNMAGHSREISKDVTLKKPASSHGRSSKGASSLEMVITSKMATDAQSEMISALENVRSLRSRVTDAEKDVLEAQKDIFEARKEATEAKHQAVRAKDVAAEAMTEALEAKRDAQNRRRDIQALSSERLLKSVSDNTPAILPASLRDNDNNEYGYSLSHHTSNGPTSLGSAPSPDLNNLASDHLGNLSRVGNDVHTDVSKTLTSHANALNERVEAEIEDAKAAAIAAKSGLNLVSLWGPVLVKICLLSVTVGAAGHLIGSIVTCFDDDDEAKGGVFIFILACIFLPAAVILTYLLAKSNIGALYKTTRLAHAAKKSAKAAAAAAAAVTGNSNASVTFSDLVTDIPPLENNHQTPREDGMEEISLGSSGSRHSNREPAVPEHVEDEIQDGGIDNPGFHEMPV